MIRLSLLLPINSELIKSSLGLLKKYGVQGLRTLDAIQFASVYTTLEQIDIAVSDNKLLNSFLSLEGVKIL